MGNVKRRPEGTRIEFQMNQNSIKAYDKAHTENRAVFRAAETTINHTKDFRVCRPKEGEPEGEKKWRPLRKGNADLHRRAEVSQAANARFMDALAPARSGNEQQRRSAAISRKLRLLREHGLIRKVPRTHRYQLTERAPRIIAAILTANRASVAQLNRLKHAA